MSLLTLEPLTRLVQARPSLGPPLELGRPFDPIQLEPAWTPLRLSLRRLAEAARTGGCCLVTGPPGSGKTALLEMFGWALESPEVATVRELAGEVAELRTAVLPWLVVRLRATAEGSLEGLLSQSLREIGLAGADPWSILEATLAGESPRFSGAALLIDRFDALLTGEPGRELRRLLEFGGARRLPVVVVASARIGWGGRDARWESYLLHHFSTFCGTSWPGRPGEWEGLVARRALQHLDCSAVATHPDLAYQLSSLLHLNVYKGRSQEWLRRWVVEGGYPLHPATLFALPRLSMLAASPERNAFRFFSDPARGGLPYFLNNSTVAQPQGQLSLFTLDQLFGYFAANLARRFAEPVAWLERAMLQARDIPLARRLLQCSWLLQLLAHERLPLRPEVVMWAAHLSDKEVAIANRSLKLLIGLGLLQFEPAQGTLRLGLEFPCPSADELLATLIARMPEDFDLYEMLSRQPPPTRLQAFEVNASLHTDRYVRVRLARPEQLSRPGWLDHQLAPCRSSEPYQGDLLLLYVAIHQGLEREELQQLIATGGAFGDPRLVLAWPGEDYPLAREARRIRASELILEGHYPFCDPLSARQAELEQQLEMARGALTRQVRELLSPSGLEFRSGDRTARNLNLSQFHHFLNQRIMDNLGRPPLVPESLFSSVCDPPRIRSHRTRCLDYLLGSGATVILLRGEPLHEPLLAALRRTGLLERAGGAQSWESCLMSTGTGPLAQALAVLESQLIGSGQPRVGLEAASVLATLAGPPYSLPAGTRELLLAVAFWRHQGSLRLHERGPEPPSARELMALVASPENWRLDYLPIDPELLPYLVGLARELEPGYQPVEGVSPWRPAVRRLLDWFVTLTPQSRELGRERTPFNAALIDLLQAKSGWEGRDRELLETLLPAALGRSGSESWSVILERFRLVRRSLARAVPATRQLLHLGLRQVFVSTEPDDQERGWPGLIAAWYSRLPRAVRDEPQEDVLKSFLGACVDADEEESLDDLLLELGYPPTPDWSRDYTSEILERVRLARAEMDYADFLGFYPVAPHLRAATAVELIRRMLLRSELGVPQLEEVLQNELEQVALHWP